MEGRTESSSYGSLGRFPKGTRGGVTEGPVRRHGRDITLPDRGIVAPPCWVNRNTLSSLGDYPFRVNTTKSDRDTLCQVLPFRRYE